MRLRTVGLIAVVALFAALVVPSTVAAKSVHLVAKMKGNEEPSGGAKGGTGTAEITVNAKKKKLCFLLTYKGIDSTVAAHIHQGTKGVDGPIVIPLEEANFPSASEGCIKNLKKGTLKSITKDPKAFYVNIHTDQFPGGAIRGQLKLVE